MSQATVTTDGNDQSERWQPNTPSEAMEQYRALPSEQVKLLRKRAQNSVYFMAKGVMGYKDVNEHTHGRFCRSLVDEDSDRDLFLMPRGHLKSSIGTEADSVRIAVNDPDNARIVIINEVLQNSIDFLNTIKLQFQQNELLRFLFPELVHPRFTGPGINWSQVSATLPRRSTWKEPTWLAIGVGGAVTSKHFSHIKADDLIGLEAKRSKAELLKAISWNANIESLAIDAFSTKIHWIGTRWGKNDLYADIIRRYGEDLRVFTRKAIEEGRIIFPEKYSWKFYRRLMEESPDIWAAQYMNDPTSDVALDFDSANLRYFKWDSAGNVVYKDKGQLQRWNWTELDRVITCDPNSGSKTAPDYAAIVVSGQAPDEKAFVLKTYARRDDPSDYVDAIFELALRWRPRVIGIEQAGQQNTIHHFEKKMKREGVYFNVVPLKHMNRVKEERIRTSLEPIVASRELFVLHSQSELIEQIKNFPDVTNDDVIDALAYAVELWRPGIKAEAAATNRKIVKRLLAQRNPLTGYGPSLVR